MRTTVVISSYNYGHLVGHCIDSVLSQVRKPDAVIVVDDGAHDGACQVAQRMGVPYLEREENLGTVANFQDMLENWVDTERVMFLGADNWLHPNCLFEACKYADFDIVTYDLFIVGAEAKKYRDIGKCSFEDGHWVRPFRNYPSFGRRLRRSNVCHGSSMFNVALAREVGGYLHHPGKKRPEEDWYLWKRMTAAGGTAVSVRKPLMYYRRHTDNFLGVY